MPRQEVAPYPDADRAANEAAGDALLLQYFTPEDFVPEIIIENSDHMKVREYAYAKAFAPMPDRDRVALFLFLSDDKLNYNRIALILGVSWRTAKRMVQRAEDVAKEYAETYNGWWETFKDSSEF